MNEEKDLNGELEEIAEMFRTELKKETKSAQTEVEEEGIVIQQLDDGDFDVEEKLCECCGENPVDKTYGEHYEYCTECREAMKHYPIGASGFLLCILALVLATLSVVDFADDFNIYNTVREGNGYYAENRNASALDSYDGALSACEDKDITATKLYLKTAEIMTKTMPNGVYSMQEIPERICEALSSFELKLPVYSKYEDMRKDALILYGTMQEFYAIVNNEEYSETYGDEGAYENIIKEIGQLSGTQIEIETADGKSKEKATVSDAMVEFCKYMFAYSAGKNDDAYTYMQKACEAGPEYVWLYAYELGIGALQNGDKSKAEELAALLYENNADSPDAYALYSSYYRMNNDTKKAIEWVEKGIELNKENAELYRLYAMAYIVNGDYETAKDACDTAMSYDNYGLLYMVAIVAENELGNSKTVDELKATLLNQGTELSEKMQKYLDGEITAQKMFCEGSGDVE